MTLKEQLIKHIEGGQAFMPLQEILPEIDFTKIGIRPMNLPYSFYELFYHMRFAQKDILDYLSNENYQAPKWPDAYWPETNAPSNKEEWEKLKKAFFSEQQKLEAIIRENDLSAPLKNKNNHTLFREIMLIVEHNAYHTGQLLVVLRLLDLHP